MKNACIFAAIGLIAVTVVGRAAAVEFESQPEYQQQQLYAGGDGQYYHADGPSSAAATAADEEDYDDAQPSSRLHHGKHKRKLQKKLKKRLLLQCLLEHRRRRRDTDASGRFALPVVLQSTNVNVAPGGGGHGYPQHQYGNGGYGDVGGCMQLGNNHGSLGSLGAPVEEASEDGNRRSSIHWYRYARRFHRNFVRPLYWLL